MSELVPVPNMFNRTTTEIEGYGLGNVLNPDPELTQLIVPCKTRYFMPLGNLLVNNYPMIARRVLTNALEDGYTQTVKVIPGFNLLSRKNQADPDSPEGFGRYYYSAMWVIRQSLFVIQVYNLIERRGCIDEIRLKKGYRKFFKPEGIAYEEKFPFFTKLHTARLVSFLDGHSNLGSLMIFRLVKDGEMDKVKALSIYGKMLLACYLQEDPSYNPKTQLLKDALAEIKGE